MESTDVKASSSSGGEQSLSISGSYGPGSDIQGPLSEESVKQTGVYNSDKGGLKICLYQLESQVSVPPI